MPANDRPLIIPVFLVHRGCPHDCLFCNQRQITGQQQSITGPEEVRRTIVEWLPRARGRQVQVAFYGGSFTCLAWEIQEQLLMAVSPFLAAGEVAGIRLSTRPDCVTPEVCRQLLAKGVRLVELGAQSMDDQVLAQASRGHSREQTLAAARMLQDAGLQIGIQLMPGLPGESTSGLFQGVAEVIALKPACVRLYPVLVLADSGLAQLWREGGYRPLTLNQAVALCTEVCRRLEKTGIQVIRIGLQAGASLEDSLLAGPYHPALGEMVRSRLWLKRLRQRLSQLRPGERLKIRVSHRDISQVVGLNRSNCRRLDALGFAGRYELEPDRHLAPGKEEYAVCQ